MGGDAVDWLHGAKRLERARRLAQPWRSRVLVIFISRIPHAAKGAPWRGAGGGSVPRG